MQKTDEKCVTCKHAKDEHSKVSGWCAFCHCRVEVEKFSD